MVPLACSVLLNLTVLRRNKMSYGAPLSCKTPVLYHIINRITSFLLFAINHKIRDFLTSQNRICCIKNHTDFVTNLILLFRTKIRGYFSVTVRIVSCDIKIRDSYNSFVFTQKNNDITKYLPLSIFSPTAVWKWRPTAWFIGSPALVLPAPSLPDTMAHFIASMSWTKPGNV